MKTIVTDFHEKNQNLKISIEVCNRVFYRDQRPYQRRLSPALCVLQTYFRISL